MQAPEVPGRNIGLMEFLFGREQIFGGYIVSEADVRLWRVTSQQLNCEDWHRCCAGTTPFPPFFLPRKNLYNTIACVKEQKLTCMHVSNFYPMQNLFKDTKINL